MWLMLIAKILLLSIFFAYFFDFIGQLVINKTTFALRMWVMLIALVTFITIQWLI